MKEAKQGTTNDRSSSWGAFALSDGALFHKRIGDCALWMKKEGCELYVATAYGLGETDEDFGADDLPWSRFVVREGFGSVVISPAMPDRPLVIKPAPPFYLGGGAKKKVYVRIPVWISLGIDKKDGIKLLEIPSVVLSNTWFGTMTEGELCYWLTSGARSQIVPDPLRDFMAICPITLANVSAQNLHVDKFALFAANSTLFFADGGLWTDETLISYKGGSEISSVEFTGRAPKEAGSAKKAADPKGKRSKKILFKAFDTLVEKHLSGIYIK